MLLSRLLGERLKEKPGEASIISHIYLLRGGYVRQVANGIYSMLLPAKRIAMKIENIIREEMDRIDGQEVLFPVVLPAELWQESGRFDSVGSELLRIKDRSGRDMLLGMTHEEAAVHLARSEAMTYTKYPFMIYQLQTKFRDEPRSRGGLIRVREFTMKDAYSFHTTQEDLELYYEKVYEAYHKIFKRVGLPQVVSVASDTGMMGGKVAHEYMLLAESGEDSIVICDSCGYRANMEVAESESPHPAKSENHLSWDDRKIAEVYTPDMKSIEEVCRFLKVEASQLIKAAVFSVEDSKKPLIVFIRGDLQVNEAKLKRVVKANVFPYDERENDGSGICFGFIGTQGIDTENNTVLFDESLKGEASMVTGANKTDYHLTGIEVDRDIAPESFVEVSKVNAGDTCTKCGGKLAVKRGIEVGNIFQLGTRYTQSMNMTYTDSDGKLKNPIMGCYGIGVGRLLACIIEACHDEYGPIWPKSVAPWQIHICMINKKNKEVRQTGLELYEKLSARYEVIMDDRDVQAGIQFADADLLGVPLRLIVSARNLEQGEVEVVSRDKTIKVRVSLTALESYLDGVV
ncbi:proline--tRNA ligase [Ruminiclostridium hungatei]|uniref:Proline--tRNA ligase n=1 Tax=Ruminiclostridium hungatei TaxID=48256 RepID=A0A1V4SEW4_RUMHU|nr:proline--tRNA ligase [Ruminiclostridium hungatei]OPX42390.1 proline--tRNA ligase [Ruminiclostridium hungatei]